MYSKSSDLLAIVSAVLMVLAFLSIITVLITGALSDKISITAKENGVKDIEYGQVVVYDMCDPEVSDIVFVWDTDKYGSAHFYRVASAENYEGFTEYTCQDDMGNEVLLNSASDHIHRVLGEDSFKYFVRKHCEALLLGALIAIFLAFGTFALWVKLNERYNERYNKCY